MKILALDASTEACSAALYINGEVHSRYEVAPRRHTRLILPMVDELLQEADLSLAGLDLLAFDRGPGSFTGIRVTMSVVQGLALASDLPVLPVSSLATLAQACYRLHAAEHVLSVIDARMGELYWGYYRLQQGYMVPTGEEQVSRPAAIIPAAADDCCVIGSGVPVYAEQLAQRGFSRLVDEEASRYPHAGYLVELAAATPEQACAVEQAQPVYLRNQVTG